VLAFLAGSVGVRAQPVVAGTLPEDYAPGLKEILEVALKQSPQMLLKNLDLAQAEVNRYFSDAPLLPNVSGSAGYGLSGSRTVSNPPSTSSSTGLTYGVGFCFFNVINLNISSLRIRMLKEYYRQHPTPLSAVELMARYPVDQMLEARLVRLASGGQIAEMNGRFFSRPGAVTAIGCIFSGLRRLLLRR